MRNRGFTLFCCVNFLEVLHSLTSNLMAEISSWNVACLSPSKTQLITSISPKLILGVFFKKHPFKTDNYAPSKNKKLLLEIVLKVHIIHQLTLKECFKSTVLFFLYSFDVSQICSRAFFKKLPSSSPFLEMHFERLIPLTFAFFVKTIEVSAKEVAFQLFRKVASKIFVTQIDDSIFRISIHPHFSGNL